MSVLIKRMGMPKSCWQCSLSQLYENPRAMLVCKITHEEVLRHNIDSNCPLVELPPHGRVIDADALAGLFYELIGHIAKRKEIEPVLEHMVRVSAVVIEMIDDAPTIIEAEEADQRVQLPEV